MGNMNLLLLSGNNIAGTLPHQYNAMNNLEWLYLSGNRLSGIIPPQWASLTQLRSLQVQDNCLEIPVPEAIANITLFQPQERPAHATQISVIVLSIVVPVMAAWLVFYLWACCRKRNNAAPPSSGAPSAASSPGGTGRGPKGGLRVIEVVVELDDVPGEATDGFAGALEIAAPMTSQPSESSDEAPLGMATAP
mmetsp:Transcript_9501/g.24160  ORF Transcript_9501/g.24160 Transcript_9501/m.24160 type:complete len:193 (+) Transcript_9501:180-758(+)